MLLSSGVIWRHRDAGGLQRRMSRAGIPCSRRPCVEQLDEAIAWLESLGASVLEHETGNPRTIGKRFDTRGLTETLAARAGHVSLGHVPGSDTGTALTGDRSFWRQAGSTYGWPASSASHPRQPVERGRRARPGSGAGRGRPRVLRSSTAGAARRDPARGGRVCPSVPVVRAVSPRSYRRTRANASRAAQVGRRRHLVQTIAHWPGGRAWYRVHESRLGERVRERTVADMIEAGARRGRCRPRRAALHLGARAGDRHPDALRDPNRPAGARRRRRGSSTPQAPMQAESRRAATRVVSQLGSSSGGSPPKKRSASRGQQVRAGPPVLRERRLRDPVHDPAALTVELDRRSHRRRIAFAVDQLVAGRLRHEEAVAVLGGHGAPSLATDSVGRKEDSDGSAPVGDRLDAHLTAEGTCPLGDHVEARTAALSRRVVRDLDFDDAARPRRREPSPVSEAPV